METLSSVHLASGKWTLFERLSLRPNFSEMKMYESGLDSRGQAVGKGIRMFPGDENKYPSFQEKRTSPTTVVISIVVTGGSDEILILPSISYKRKRDTCRGV